MSLPAPSLPLTDPIIVAVAQLVDDAQSVRRDPSHADLDHAFKRAGIIDGDPKSQGQNAGKAKRIRSTLSWAMEHNPRGGGDFVYSFIGTLRGYGAFRETSPNYVGRNEIENAIAVFGSEGYTLSADGELRPKILDSLSGTELTEALHGYIRRAKQGSQDAALVTGTGKDLLEAVAAHILQQRYGSYLDRPIVPLWEINTSPSFAKPTRNESANFCEINLQFSVSTLPFCKSAAIINGTPNSV